ncbi:intermembrane transport protein PqiB [Glaciecola sp. 1036]|uniref:intermembrane transport protein PqiB n=1 Tax=Alteromonadaceae TaxID=72275 RepID=UPI003D02387D
MTDQQPVIPEIKNKKGISWVWLLPIIAALVGGGLLYQSWLNRGIDIIVQFDDAQGIEARRTLVKYRNVDIGRVERIRFADDGKSILTDIKINRDAQRFLKIDSHFWVVRPRIGATGISGVGTLLSGAYIALEPGEEKNLSDSFVGLSRPPVASPSEAGIKLDLISYGGKSLFEGNPVVYRGISVGVVESIDFDIEDRSITYGIFIRAPFDKLVTSNTHFWNASGITVSTSVSGIEVDFSSLESLVAGGVAFDVPEDLTPGEAVSESTTFKLYPSQLATIEERQYETITYVILVEETVGGLDTGAPVEYRGIKIGRVAKPYLGFYETNEIRENETRIPVVINIEPARITQRSNESNIEGFTEHFEHWIKNGLQARIETANYITGSLKVTLDFNPAGVGNYETFGEYPIIPLAEGGFASLLSKTDALLEKLNALPIEQLLQSTDQTVLVAQDTLISMQSLVNTIESTMKEVDDALQGVQPDSAVYHRLMSSLDELEQTLLMVQPMISDISNKPNSLIFSDAAPEDKEPNPDNSSGEDK